LAFHTLYTLDFYLKDIIFFLKKRAHTNIMLSSFALLLLMAAAGARGGDPAVPCAGKFADLNFCDFRTPFDQRVADLISALEPAEKIALFENGAGAVPRLGIPAYQWWSEALHGVAGSPGVHFRAPTPVATSFPQVCLTSAAFNKTLWARIGRAAGTEGRAMYNADNAGLTFWAPNINIFRDPRWGRGQETPGEDPFTNSEYAAQFVYNFQYEGHHGGTKYLRASACCKHFAAYSLEDWHGMDRYHFNAVVDQQDCTPPSTPDSSSTYHLRHAFFVFFVL
jgi:xylan 1,4-beta-xylosidase